VIQTNSWNSFRIFDFSIWQLWFLHTFSNVIVTWTFTLLYFFFVIILL
jgi:hypothetical protein